MTGTDMGKKPKLLVILIIILALATVGITVVFERFVQPSATIYSTYVEVYKDILPEEISTIRLNSVNHKVVIGVSSDEKYHLSYFQKVDNNNIYSIDRNILNLNIIEAAENLDNLFYKSKRAIDTITILVPENETVNLYNKTVSGSLTIAKINVSQLQAISVNGKISISSITADKVSVESNSGEVSIDSSVCQAVDISNVTGRITLSLDDTINAYSFDINANYGSLYINGSVVNDADGQLCRQFESASASPIGTVKINSTRSYVSISTLPAAETTTEPDQTDKTTQ